MCGFSLTPHWDICLRGGERCNKKGPCADRGLMCCPYGGLQLYSDAASGGSPLHHSQLITAHCFHHPYCPAELLRRSGRTRLESLRVSSSPLWQSSCPQRSGLLRRCCLRKCQSQLPRFHWGPAPLHWVSSASHDLIFSLNPLLPRSMPCCGLECAGPERSLSSGCGGWQGGLRNPSIC